MRTVAAGEALLAPAITRRLIERYVARPPDRAGAARRSSTQLSPRERETLLRLARGRSNAEIAGELVRSARRPSRPRRRACCASSTCATGCRPWCWAYETGLVAPGEPDLA